MRVAISLMLLSCLGACEVTSVTQSQQVPPPRATQAQSAPKKAPEQSPARPTAQPEKNAVKGSDKINQETLDRLPEEGFANILQKASDPNIDAAIFNVSDSSKVLRYGKLDVNFAIIGYVPQAEGEIVVIDWGEPRVYKTLYRGLKIYFRDTGKVVNAPVSRYGEDLSYRVVKVRLPDDVPLMP